MKASARKILRIFFSKNSKCQKIQNPRSILSKFDSGYCFMMVYVCRKFDPDNSKFAKARVQTRFLQKINNPIFSHTPRFF